MIAGIIEMAFICKPAEMNIAHAVPAKSTKSAADNKQGALTAVNSGTALTYDRYYSFGQDPRSHAIPEYTKKSVTDYLP